MSNMIKSHNLFEIYNLLDEFKKDQIRMNRFANEIKNEENETLLNKKIKLFLSEFERIFLKYKVLNLYLDDDLDKKIIDSFVQNDPLFCGVCNYFDSELIMVNNDYLLYKLPPLTGNRRFENGSYRGEFIGNIIQLLTVNFLQEEGIYFKKIYKGTIVFEHHFEKESTLNNMIDPDNIESKKALDGLNGLVIEDDSIININLIHLSQNDVSAFTKLHVVRNEYMGTWIQKHLKLFEK